MRSLALPGLPTKVSTIALGTAAFGSLVPSEASFAMLDAFVAAGGTLIDTAHVYADWLGGERHLSEKTLGLWLKRRGKSDDVVIASKGAHPDLATPLVPRLSPREIVHDLDESLQCLGVERIDLYYLHRDDPARPVAEIMEVLGHQVRLGKIGAIGCSNWQVARIAAAQAHARAAGLPQFVASQVFWSLATANPGAFASDHALIDDAALQFYAAQDMPVVAYTSQARGFFSKAAQGGVDRLKPELRAAFENAENLARLDRAKVLALELGVTVSAITLAYLTSQTVAGIPVIGPMSMAQLQDSLGAADLKLTAGQTGFLLGHDRGEAK